jgi:hypothetical protein
LYIRAVLVSIKIEENNIPRSQVINFIFPQL